MRARVNQRLARATHFPVTLVVAPAGFGKSVALRDFLTSSGLPHVRYDVRREDGALLAFVRKLSEALSPVAPSAIAAFPAMQERVLATDEPVRQLSDWFAEHLKDAACTIVIDDLHYAGTDPASIALLSDIVERTSDRIKWIIAARSDVGLPVATWIAYGRMDIPIGEDDLRFTTAEALLAAGEIDTQFDPQEVESLRQLTEGWPVALIIALRTRTNSTDVRTASFGTRELVYRYLAEQIYTGLSPQQRAFALSSCVFSVFDQEIAGQLGANAEFVDDFRAKTSFLHETAPGEYRYHDLFRDFLESELRRTGEREWALVLCRAGDLLRRRSDISGALVLYTKARATAHISAVIETDGFTLFERGETAKLSLALDILPEGVRHASAAATGLRAMIDATLGRFEIAQHGFLAAIALAQADDDLRLHLVQRYAIELVRSDRDCVPFLEPYALDAGIANRYRAPLLATLATGYVHAGRAADALRAVEHALRLADDSVWGEARARLYQQAAYVERYGGSKKKAGAYAAIAVELALSNNLYELAARAYSVLYTIVRNSSDDPAQSLAVLSKLGECARKGASSQAAFFALVATFDIEVERGDEAALERLDREMQVSQAYMPRLQSTAVLPVQALRSAWTGDFARAYTMLAGTARDQTTSEQRALRAAETGLYAVAAGLQDEGESQLQEAVRAFDQSSASSTDIVRARLLAALAEILRGHDAAAHRHISEAEHGLSPAMPRQRAFARAVRAFYRRRLEQVQTQDVDDALELLRREHFGGMARLLQALPLAQRESGYSALTPAEREILQLLAKGASSKDVAAQTRRSRYTVDTHVRSICRKLQCSGRREAVALATSQGWVET